MTKVYRLGATGALIDIYEQTLDALKNVIADITNEELAMVTDPLTADENCRSVQTILSHVVHSAYGYATSIYNLKGHCYQRPAKVFRVTISEYLKDLDLVFAFTEMVFKQINDSELEQFDSALKIKAGWGQLYDTEQMAEHAIIHVLRHTRQIERIKTKRPLYN